VIEPQFVTVKVVTCGGKGNAWYLRETNPVTSVVEFCEWSVIDAIQLGEGLDSVRSFRWWLMDSGGSAVGRVVT